MTLLFLAAVVAGAIASVTGFGIGSLLTPVFGLQVGVKLAVAAVSIPHFVGTVQRFWRLRASINRRVLWGFGVTSAAGGLAGALLHSEAGSRALSIIFGALLLLAGSAQVIGFMERIRWGRRVAWIAGAVSGLFGGLVGNQGGIRTAAMLGFDVPKEAFVATAAAIALVVDGARMPVYFVVSGADLVDVAGPIAIATLGVVIGTTVGTRVLTRLPPRRFRQIVGVLLLVLGVYMLFKP